jgi:hypothetical protein
VCMCLLVKTKYHSQLAACCVCVSLVKAHTQIVSYLITISRMENPLNFASAWRSAFRETLPAAE